MLDVWSVGHDDGVGSFDGIDVGDARNVEEPFAHSCATAGSADRVVVPSLELWTRDAEELGCHGDLERVGPVADDRHHPVIETFRHVPYLSLVAMQAKPQSGGMQSEPIDLTAALATFTEHWQPRIIANFNDYDVRVAKVLGEYVWHQHDDTDELFMVISGELTIDLEAHGDADERTVVLAAGSVYVVPRGIRHRPRARSETVLFLLDPTGTRTTGDFEGELPDHLVSTTGVPLG